MKLSMSFQNDSGEETETQLHVVSFSSLRSFPRLLVSKAKTKPGALALTLKRILGLIKIIKIFKHKQEDKEKKIASQRENKGAEVMVQGLRAFATFAEDQSPAPTASSLYLTEPPFQGFQHTLWSPGSPKYNWHTERDRDR